MGAAELRGRVPVAFAALLLAAASAPLGAQGPPMPAAPVGYAEAVNRPVRRSIELTGSVEPRDASLVASEVAGLVVALPAREGDRVRRGQALVRLRDETARLRLQAAQGQLEEARARLKLAEATRQRMQGLFEEKVISRQTLDDAITEVEAGLGRVTQLEAEVARLEDELERTVVRAPFDGVVVREHVAVGEWVGAGEEVAELVDTVHLEVELEVPEAYFAGIGAGATVPVILDALGGREIEGEVAAVVPRADPRARTFPVKVRIENAEGAVGPGMLARVRLPVGEPQASVLVPKDAILTDGNRRSVFVIGDDNQVRPVPVKTGTALGAWIALEGGIQPGDRVVTQGNERLFPGQPVDPKLVEYERP